MQQNEHNKMNTAQITEPESLWKEIEKDEFFATVGSLNVHPSIQLGPYPYMSLWKAPNGQVLGKSVGYRDGGTIKTSWFTPYNVT